MNLNELFILTKCVRGNIVEGSLIKKFQELIGIINQNIGESASIEIADNFNNKGLDLVRVQKSIQAMSELEKSDTIIVQNFKIKRIHTLASITINGLFYLLLIVVIFNSYRCFVC